MCQNLNNSDVLDEPGTYGAQCHRKVASERKVAGIIRSLVNARSQW